MPKRWKSVRVLFITKPEQVFVLKPLKKLLDTHWDKALTALSAKLLRDQSGYNAGKSMEIGKI